MKKNVSDVIERLDEIFDLKPVIKNFGRIVKTIRTSQKISQKTLAEEISKKTGIPITQSHISRTEANKRYFTAFEYMAFCSITGCSFGMIVGVNDLVTRLKKSDKD